MKSSLMTMRWSPVALAAALALSSGMARADDDEVAALTQPSNVVELGLYSLPRGSTKFGEYSGLIDPGNKLTGQIHWRGGSGYADNQSGATRRWSLLGTDLGLTSGALGLTLSEQGEWALGLNYDELRHNLGNGYQTPYVGTSGGNTFTLPAGFGLVTTSGTGALGTNNLSVGQLAAFHPLDISTVRKTTQFTGKVAIDSHLDLNVDYSHLQQTGSKLMGFGAGGFSSVSGEVVSILPMPTQSMTDNINLALNWKGDRAHLSGSYYGSFYRDDYTRVNFQTFAGASLMQPMTTPPNNDLHQLSLAGGYELAAKTRLAGSVSRAQNTQNEPFVMPETGTMVTAPSSGLFAGKVINTHADLKITDQNIQNWTLSGLLRFDERENLSPSNLYNFNAISGGNTANYANTPLSTKKGLLELAGDYRIASGHALRVALTHEDVSRWCDHYATVSAAGCVVARQTRDDRLDAGYRMKYSDGLDFKLGYGYSDRQTLNEPLAIAAFISTKGVVPLSSTAAPAGQNAGDYYGFNPFFDASRVQQSIKGSVNWQPNEVWQLGFGTRFTDDVYGSSTYGVQNGNSWSWNFDASHAYSETGTFYGYVQEQRRMREMTNLQSVTSSTASATKLSNPALATWTNRLNDNDVTIGAGLKQTGLMRGKLELSGDVSYSFGRGIYGTLLNYNGLNSGGLGCASAAFLSCGQLPAITSSMTQIKIAGVYRMSKTTSLNLRYLHQELHSSDYYYNGMVYTYTPSSLMPTNQAAPNYKIDAVMVSWLYQF